MNLRQHLKFLARGFLAAAKPSPLIVGAVGLGIYAVLSILDGEITNSAANNQIMVEAYQQYMEHNNFDHLMNTIFNSILPIHGVSTTQTYISLNEAFQRQVHVDCLE